MRAPDHLGDGVMALPALDALCRGARGPVVVQGPGWCGALYRHLPVTLSSRAAPGLERVVLLKPSLGAAIDALSLGAPRVGLATPWRRWLLSVAVPERGPHRVDDLCAVARAAGAEPEPAPRYPTSDADLPALPPLPSRAVLLVPGTASPATVRWPGFRALADLLDGRAVFVGGPADMAYIQEIAGPHPVLPPLSIPAFARLCALAEAVVGNDSGLPHLAAAARRAAGAPLEAVHVVYGSTDPARTGPPGSTTHHGTRPPCWPCYKKRCGIGTPCLDARPEDLRARLG